MDYQFYIIFNLGGDVFLHVITLQEDPVLLTPSDRREKPYVAIIKVNSLSNQLIIFFYNTLGLLSDLLQVKDFCIFTCSLLLFLWFT